MTDIQREILNIDNQLKQLNEIDLNKQDPIEKNKIINNKNELINKSRSKYF